MGEKNSVIIFAVRNNSHAMRTKAYFKPFTCETPTISLLFVHFLEQVLQSGHGIFDTRYNVFYLPAAPLAKFVPYTSSAALKKESVPTNTVFKYLRVFIQKIQQNCKILIITKCQ